MLLDPSRWQIRCLTCGRRRGALDAGIIRLAPPKRKYTLAWCSACRWLRCAVIEPTRDTRDATRDATTAPTRPGSRDRVTPSS